jgi:predicted transcriptional regulator
MTAAHPLDADPIFAAIDAAPLGEPFTPEQRAELDEAMDDIAAGRVELVDHEDVPAWLEAHARLGRTA